MLTARRAPLRVVLRRPWSAEIICYCSRRHFSDQRGNPPKKPSLIEQLFPEETKRYEEQQKALREVPPLPIVSKEDWESTNKRPWVLKNPSREEAMKWQALNKAGQTKAKTLLQEQIQAAGPGVGVLVLRNASKNLTEEDFKRLVPQGRHIEGWTLQQGDIMKVIPGRDLDTLEQNNVYYILFNSDISAFTYQGHVTKIHKLAAAHQPTSAFSSIPPPPGYMIEGLDAHSAIQAYALVPPSQKLELRQLRRPLTPTMQAIVTDGGYKPVVDRADKMPFEARLTMEGPQLQTSTIRHIMNETGRQRGLSWSGGENFDLRITRWEAKALPNVTRNSDAFATRRADWGDSAGNDVDLAKTQKQRTLNLVYIVGFHSEEAAQTFVTYWHHRKLESASTRNTHAVDEGEDPPVARVEMMW